MDHALICLQLAVRDRHRAVRCGQRLNAHAFVSCGDTRNTVDHEIIHADLAVLERDHTAAETERLAVRFDIVRNDLIRRRCLGIVEAIISVLGALIRAHLRCGINGRLNAIIA